RSIYPDDGQSAELLLQQADMALYGAKTRGRNEVVFFGEATELKSFQQKAHLRSLLSQAITTRSIQVAYQPIIDTRTGRTVGAEALARWERIGHGWISPGTFVPLAENMGLIEELGKQVLESALEQLSRWRGQGFHLKLSVNISVRQLFKFDFLSDLLQLTARNGVHPGQLVLEITESQTLLGSISEAQRLEELSENGFLLSIDDFGQGYSSLSSLHELPVNELKIDMKFVRNLHTEKGRRILHAIVDMTKMLGLETVAEGVEEKEHVTALRKMDVDRLQGFYFSPPLLAPEFFEFLRR
ncbi:MAG: GGDEF domain-containing phosphodiesterase, partial [Candidatus Omnitrophica bacterium]|nr:GGDEF domain-containing phosphodiesterase [Candidatus Omnitrophota bacterium]